MEEYTLSEAYSSREFFLFNKEHMENEKINIKDELEKSVIYILNYCKEHGVFAYNDYMERSFNHSLMEIIKFHREQHDYRGRRIDI